MEEQKYETQLWKIFDNVNNWLKFAEAKNFGLLTLNAAVAFGFTKIEFVENSIFELAGRFTVYPFTILSFLAALISLFPILSKIEMGTNAKNWINSFSNHIDEEKEFENIHFYGYLKGIDLVKFEMDFLDKTNSNIGFTKFEKDLAIQILYNSRITWLKYQLFKIGAYSFMIGIILFVIASILLNFLI